MNLGDMVNREEAVGRLHDFLYMLFPDVPEPRAEGPLSGVSGFTQTSANTDRDRGKRLQGLEGDEGEPKGGGPVAGPQGFNRPVLQQSHFSVEEVEQGGQIMGRATHPDMGEGHNRAAAARPPEVRGTMPAMA